MATSYTFPSIAVPGSSATTASGINDSDKIVGSYVDSAGNTYGFLDNKDSFTTIDVSGASSTVAPARIASHSR